MEHEVSTIKIRRPLEDIVALAVLVRAEELHQRVCRKLREAF